MYTDKEVQKILNEVRKEYSEYGISPEHMEEIYFSFFKYVKRLLLSPELPTISIYGFGRFVPNKARLRTHIRKQLRNLGIMTKISKVSFNNLNKKRIYISRLIKSYKDL